MRQARRILFALVAAAVIPGAYAQQSPYREDGWGKLPDGRRRSEERRVGKECRSRWSPYH